MKWRLPEIEYERDVTVFRKFTDVIAGTGTVFAALHVFIGYMSFDDTPSATGEVPHFFDQIEYRYYLILALLFALTVIVSKLFQRLPALVLLPATATTTFVMLLYHAKHLPKGPMAFLQFSLFAIAGCMIVTLMAKGWLHREIFRYVICGLGLFSAGWALMIYFRAPNAINELFGLIPPIEALDGIEAVQRYERIEALAALAEADHHVHYLRVALAQILSAAVVLLLPRYKFVTGLSGLLMFAYPAFLFSFSYLTYYPMFCLVPIMVFAAGCIALCLSRAVPDEDEELLTEEGEAEKASTSNEGSAE